MFLGYIIGDNHPLLKTIEKIEEAIEAYPVLIVGYQKALETFPAEAFFSSKIIDKEKQIYYCFSFEESKDKYKEGLYNFLTYCFKDTVREYEIIRVLDLVYLRNIIQSLDGYCFYYETKKAIVITHLKKIYYINKEYANFFFVQIKDNLKYELVSKKLNVLAWDGPLYIGAFLKLNKIYKEKQALIFLLKPFGDIDLYMGALCLERSLYQKIKDQESLNVIYNIYIAENYLSNLKIKVDEELIESRLEEGSNSILENIQKAINLEGFIIQKYNGSDKITGRIYATDSTFSVQTLSYTNKDIIIPYNRECLLIEFDYKYFEYNLLTQIANLPIVGDPHSYLSNFLFGNSDFRSLCKGINYGLLYGKNLDKTIEEIFSEPNIKADRSDIEKKLRLFVDLITNFNVTLRKEFKQNGYILNYFKRRIYPEKNYALVNNYIQSTAADIIIRKILKIRELLTKYNPLNSIVLQNHDSVLLNFCKYDIENTDIVLKIKEILEESENGLFNKVSLKYGTNWRDLT